MTDTRFRYRFVPKGYEHQVQRYAVLHPLVDVPRTRGGVVLATEALVKSWRLRLNELVSNGWRCSASLQNLRNCRPAFAHVLPVGWCCRTLFCPFCYARRVGDVWQMLAAACPGKRQLLERTVLTRLPYYGRHPKTFETLSRRLEAILHDTLRVRTEAIQRTAALGGYQQATIEPGHYLWRVKIRQLLVYDEDVTIPQNYRAEAPRRHVRVHACPSPETLVGAVGRVCRYPVGMLRGDPTNTVLLLQTLAAHRVRLTSTFGLLRGKGV